MFTANVIGNVAADANTKSINGNEFTTFRVAHNDRWTDDKGNTHDNVVWVDCIMNGRPKVADYIKQGTTLYVSGTVTLRVYSSKRDRCMKAGVQISVRTVELVGSKQDTVPSRLYDSQGVEHKVERYYNTDVENVELYTSGGVAYQVRENGWVWPVPVLKEEHEAAPMAEPATPTTPTTPTIPTAHAENITMPNR